MPVDISVITPTRNYGHFLPDALRSVSGSCRLQHVVQDALSEDDTVNLLSSWPADHLVWTSEQDAGQSDALNRGLAKCRGEVIGWLNADEAYVDGTLARVHQVFASRPELDVLFGERILVREDMTPIRLVGGHGYSRFVLRSYGPYLPSCSFFVRRGVLEEVGGWDVSLRRIMDWDLYLKLSQRAGTTFAYVPDVLAYYRVHRGQVSGLPAPPDHPEHLLVRQRYGLPMQPAVRKAHYQLGRLAFRARKAASGGYFRERRYSASLPKP